MFSIPLSVFVIIYFVLLLVVLIFLAIIVHHLVATGTFTVTSFIFTFLVIAAMILVLYFTWSLSTGIDWTSDIVLFKGNSFGLPSSGF